MKKRTGKTASLIPLVVYIVYGCATSGHEQVKEQRRTTIQQELTEGKSTKAEILAAMGNADRIRFGTGGTETWIYEWAASKPATRTFNPMAGQLDRSADGKKKDLVVTFDRKGVVSRFSMNVSEDVIDRRLLR